MIKAVIFDMDGLLIDSEPYWKQINQETYLKLGVKITDVDRQDMMGRPSVENARLLFNRYGWEEHTPEEVSGMIVQGMIEAASSDLDLMPGVHDVLQICKKAELPVAIASSSPKILIDAVVDNLKIREHFEQIYSAEQEPYGKPHPGVFISVAKQLDVEPAECLVFEDSPSGVLAAKAAKMHCVAVPEPALKEHKFIQTADLILSSLDEFNEKILESF